MMIWTSANLAAFFLATPLEDGIKGRMSLVPMRIARLYFQVSIRLRIYEDREDIDRRRHSKAIGTLPLFHWIQGLKNIPTSVDVFCRIMMA